MSTSLPRPTRLLLATYPPSFKERYGDELAALLEDRGATGTTIDLVSGSLRAWIRPTISGDTAPGREARVMSTASTVWVAWVVAFFAGGTWLRGITDGIVPALRTRFGWTVYLLGQAAFTVGWVAVALIVLTLFALVSATCLRHGSFAPLRPLRTFVSLLAALALATGGIAALARLGSSFPAGRASGPSPWFAAALLAWLALVAATAVAGMLGPVGALRRSRISPGTLRLAVRVAAVPVASLVILAACSLAVSGYELDRHEVTGWGSDLMGSAGLACAATIAVVSYARSLRSLQKPVGSRTV